MTSVVIDGTEYVPKTELEPKVPAHPFVVVHNVTNLMRGPFNSDRWGDQVALYFFNAGVERATVLRKEYVTSNMTLDEYERRLPALKYTPPEKP